MKTSNNNSVKFYQNLGKLFYAIAASDKNVKASEFNKLKEIVKSDWLTIDEFEDDFSSDSAFQIEIVFDWLNSEESFDANDCFNEFVEYKKMNEKLFSESIDKLIMKTAHKIADSFSGINKSELMMLAKLDMELKKTS